MDNPKIPCTKRVLLVGWDGVDWDLASPLIDAGRLPHLQKLLENGVCGKLAGIAPLVSSPLWTSVVTGQRPPIHGIIGDFQTTDNSRSMRPFGSPDRRTPALWNLIEAQGLKSHVFGWPAMHPAEPLKGFSVSNLFSVPGASRKTWPLLPGTVLPESVATDLAELRLHPAEFAAADLEPMIPGVGQVNLREDSRPWKLAVHLAATVSINAATSFALQQGPWNFAAVFFDAPGAVVRDFGMYSPPKLKGIPDSDFALYSTVVEKVMEMHDQILGLLVSLAGADGVVVLCSPFGHSTASQRITPQSGEHLLHMETRRFPGLLMISGNGVKKDEWILNPHLLDITPSILAMLGLKIPRHLPGRPLVEALRQSVNLSFNTSTESIDAISPWNLPTPKHCADEASTESLLPWENSAQNLLHLALFHLHAGEFAEAQPILEQICEAQPERLRPALDLIACLLALGKTDEAEQKLEEIANRPQGGLKIRTGVRPKFLPEYDLARGLICLARNDAARALEHLQRAGKSAQQLPGYYAHLGATYLRLKMWTEARAAFRKSVRIDPTNSQAQFGVATASYRLRKFADAAEAALETTALTPNFGPAHLLIGLCLERLGEPVNAILALQTAVKLGTAPRLAHKVLARIYRRKPETANLAILHQTAACQWWRQIRSGKKSPGSRSV